MWISVIAAGIGLAVAFGLGITDGQREAILQFAIALITILGGVAIRQSVVPVSKIEDKGLSPKTLNPVKKQE